MKVAAVFARNLHLRLKPDCLAQFTKTIDKEVIPSLQKQKGFQDEITFVTPNGTEVVGISLWEEKEDAAAYDRRAHSSVLKALENVAESTPEVQNYQVANSAFHKIKIVV